MAQEPANYESLLASAQQAQAKGEFNIAAAFYQKASTIHPEIAELKANLGLMYYQTDKLEQAADAFRQALHLRPGLFVPNLFLGLDCVKLKHFNEAIPYLKQAAHSRPDDIHIQVGLGQAYSGIGDTRLAIRSYSKATEIEPANADVWYGLGMGYFEQVEADARILIARHRESVYLQALMAENFAERGAFIQAGKSYQKILSLAAFPPGTHANYAFVLLSEHDLTSATRELDSELAVNPSSLMARLGMVWLELEQGALEDAAKQIALIWHTDAGFLMSNVQRLNPGMAHANRTEFHDALTKLQASGELPEEGATLFESAGGTASTYRSTRPNTDSPNASKGAQGDATELYNRGEYRRCSDLLSPRLSSLPPNELRRLAFCAYATGANDYAFYAAENLSSSPSTEAEGLYWETKASQRLAAEALARASEIDTRSAKLHVLLGDIYRQQKHPSEAEREYRKALNLQPQDPGALFGVSLALLANGQIDEALHVAQGAAKDNPSDPEMNAVMGEILCQRENFIEAEAFLKKSLNTKPEYVSHVHALLGKVYANTNRIQEAIAELKLALPDDKNGHLYYQIGRLYLKAGDRDLAQRAFLESKRLQRVSLAGLAPDLDPNQGDSDSR
jgi:tetratricopeptide (TPR) repeat protein